MVVDEFDHDFGYNPQRIWWRLQCKYCDKIRSEEYYSGVMSPLGDCHSNEYEWICLDCMDKWLKGGCK